MAKHKAPTSRAGRRTAFQNALTYISLGLLALPAFALIVGEELTGVLPAEWLAVLAAVGVAATAINTALARLMAIPAINRLLDHLGLGNDNITQENK